MNLTETPNEGESSRALGRLISMKRLTGFLSLSLSLSVSLALSAVLLMSYQYVSGIRMSRKIFGVLLFVMLFEAGGNLACISVG